MAKLKASAPPIKSIKQARKIIFAANKKFARVKCNCGHYPKDHYQNSGWCHDSSHKNAGQCGCTFYYPNDKYIARQKKK
jgi:hypothetical protein